MDPEGAACDLAINATCDCIETALVIGNGREVTLAETADRLVH